MLVALVVASTRIEALAWLRPFARAYLVLFVAAITSTMAQNSALYEGMAAGGFVYSQLVLILVGTVVIDAPVVIWCWLRNGDRFFLRTGNLSSPVGKRFCRRVPKPYSGKGLPCLLRLAPYPFEEYPAITIWFWHSHDRLVQSSIIVALSGMESIQHCSTSVFLVVLRSQSNVYAAECTTTGGRTVCSTSVCRAQTPLLGS